MNHLSITTLPGLVLTAGLSTCSPTTPPPSTAATSRSATPGSPGEELPSNLTDSASAEPGTPYWSTAVPERFRVTPGRTTDLGHVDLHLRR